MYSIDSGPFWRETRILVYRYLPAEADWDAWSSYPTDGGRFDADQVPTLYVAQSANGAVAEYLHRFPEFIGLSTRLILRLWELEVDLVAEALDVREEAGQAIVGITLDRLTSQEADTLVRYRECRELVRLVVGAGLAGIAYPSAAATWAGAWNLVLIGDSHASSWRGAGVRVVDPPILQQSEVRQLDAG